MQGVSRTCCSVTSGGQTHVGRMRLWYVPSGGWMWGFIGDGHELLFDDVLAKVTVYIEGTDLCQSHASSMTTHLGLAQG